MKTKILFILAGAVVLVIAGTILFSSFRNMPVATASSHRAEAPSVHTIVVSAQPMQESILATGTVRADESIELRAETSGKLRRILFTEGTPVRRGELLAVIEDAELRATLQRAVYRRDLAELKARRTQTLIARGGVPQQDYDIAASEHNVLQAEVALIEAQLAHTQILAPFDGVVGLRAVSEGAYLTPSVRIATFQRLDRLKIDFSIPEKYAALVAPGSEVTITATALSKSLTGTVYALEPLIDAATRTVQVRATCTEPTNRLFSGGFVSVRLNLSIINNAIMVPSLAVVPESNSQTVFVLENGLAMRREVRTGTRTASTIQIVEGLSLGETIITSGQQQVRSGQPVRILMEEPDRAVTIGLVLPPPAAPASAVVLN